jgi:hypothetical protein
MAKPSLNDSVRNLIRVSDKLPQFKARYGVNRTRNRASGKRLLFLAQIPDGEPGHRHGDKTSKHLFGFWAMIGLEPRFEEYCDDRFRCKGTR